MQGQATDRREHPGDGDAIKGQRVPARWGMSPAPRLHVLHLYTRLKMSSSKVSMMVRNMSESPIFLKKGVQVAWAVSASPVPSVELSAEMEAILRKEAVQEPMSVTTQQEKLLEKLNLDSLSNWTP